MKLKVANFFVHANLRSQKLSHRFCDQTKNVIEQKVFQISLLIFVESLKKTTLTLIATLHYHFDTKYYEKCENKHLAKMYTIRWHNNEVPEINPIIYFYRFVSNVTYIFRLNEPSAIPQMWIAMVVYRHTHMYMI